MKTTRPTHVRRLLVGLAVVAFGLSGLATGPVAAAQSVPQPPAVASAPTAGASTRGDIRPVVPKLTWGTCAGPGRAGFQCATARVPLDYAHPGGAQINLAVIRLPATDQAHRIGSLFFNPGGPGGPGVAALPVVARFFSPQVRARFDLVSWDPRGVGESTSVQCFASLAAENAFMSKVPAIPVGSSQERQLIARNAELGRRCAARSGDLLRYVSTADSARDLDLLRAAVHDAGLNYYGISYGTFLGATYANLFPHRVRALVLDGDVNPQSWVGWLPSATGGRLGTFLRQKSDKGSGLTLNAFLDQCARAGKARCAFSAGTPSATRAKFATLIAQMRSHSLTTRGGYTYSTFLDAVANSLYFMSDWRGLAHGMQNVWLDKSSGTLAKSNRAEKYQGVGQQLAVLCGESPNPAPVTFPWQSVFSTTRSGPTGAYWAWVPGACASWPATAAQRYVGPWNRATAAPVLLVSTTYDPATPYENAVDMTRLLAQARLLTVTGYGHTALLNPSTCANQYSGRYLISGTLPPAGTRCRQDAPPFA